MIYEIFSSKALHMNSKICIAISVEVQETAQPARGSFAPRASAIVSSLKYPRVYLFEIILLPLLVCKCDMTLYAAFEWKE